MRARGRGAAPAVPGRHGTVDVVVPTVGRPSLAGLLHGLAADGAAFGGRMLVVDDRTRADGDVLAGHEPPAALAGRLVVLRSHGAGPAAARNVGWRASRAAWVVFLDDDVVPDRGWSGDLAADLRGAETAGAVAVQGGVRVPRPAGRRPTDWERNTIGLEDARWATADMAVRRDALAAVGGFDERFPRAYREDAELGLRLVEAGGAILCGRRVVEHAVRPAGPWASVRRQAGNADDVLMRALHGRRWRARAGVPRGRRRRHLAITAAAGLAAAGVLAGRKALAVAGAVGWVGGTAELAWARIAPGPRDRGEVATMLATSLVLPPAASVWWAWGWLRLPGLLARPPAAAPGAVLLDRDGTLIRDVPYNGDPGRVTPMPGARAALDRLRAAGVRLAVVSNQSGVARGLVTRDQVDAVNERVEELLGPLGPWLVCPHAEVDGCDCRKPAPGLVERAAAKLGVATGDCAVVGDIGADVDAALAAGARPVLVPTERTRQEVDAAPEVARDLQDAVTRLLSGAWAGGAGGS